MDQVIIAFVLSAVTNIVALIAVYVKIRLKINSLEVKMDVVISENKENALEIKELNEDLKRVEIENAKRSRV